MPKGKSQHTQRYEAYDPLGLFYKQNKSGYDEFIRLKGSITEQVRKFVTQIKYKENIVASDATGGDHDFIILDHKKKEWCWWECGFSPFCQILNNPKYNIKGFDLEYWTRQRH
jgi:hypothetical protein